MKDSFVLNIIMPQLIPFDSSMLIDLVEQITQNHQSWVLRCGNLISANPTLNEPILFKSIANDFYNMGIGLTHNYYNIYNNVNHSLSWNIEVSVANIFTGYSYTAETPLSSIVYLNNLYRSIANLNLAILGTGLTFFDILMYKASLISDVIHSTQSTHVPLYSGPITDLSQYVEHLSTEQWKSVLDKLRYIRTFNRFTILLAKWKFNILIDHSFCDFTHKVKKSKKFGEFEFTEDKLNFLALTSSSAVSSFSNPYID